MFIDFRKSKVVYALAFVYLAFVVWWLVMYMGEQTDTTSNLAYGLAYSLVSLFGGVSALGIAKQWGGFKSAVGKGLGFFGLGLLGLTFGQMTFSYYNFIADVEVPFPSLADVGYVSILLFYTLGGLYLAKAAGAKFSLRTMKGRAWAVVIPLAMLVLSYFLYLKDSEADTDLLVNLLTFGTPIGQAIYISIAIVTFQLSRSLLGGVMRKRILLLVFALVVEYLAEFLFFFRANRDQYYNGDISDLAFVTAIVVMTVGIYSFKLRKSPDKLDVPIGGA